MQLKNLVLPLTKHVLSHAALTDHLTSVSLSWKKWSQSSLPAQLRGKLEGSDEQIYEEVPGKVWEILFECTDFFLN